MFSEELSSTRHEDSHRSFIRPPCTSHYGPYTFDSSTDTSTCIRFSFLPLKVVVSSDYARDPRSSGPIPSRSTFFFLVSPLTLPPPTGLRLSQSFAALPTAIARYLPNAPQPMSCWDIPSSCVAYTFPKIILLRNLERFRPPRSSRSSTNLRPTLLAPFTIIIIITYDIIITSDVWIVKCFLPSPWPLFLILI